MAKGKVLDEGTAFVEIGGYVHQDPGEARVRMYVSDVNKPLVTEDAELTKRLKKVKVSMKVEEDTSVAAGQVYAKDCRMWQDEDPAESPKGTTSTSKSVVGPTTAAGGDPVVPSGDDPLNKGERFLKNMIKNTNAWLLLTAAVAIVALAVAAAALFR